MNSSRILTKILLTKAAGLPIMIHVRFFSLQLDRTVSLEQYGFVVAADALGQLIFSPIFGLIADRLDSIRLVSLICCLTFCLGNALYANVSLVPANLLGKAFEN